MVKNDGQDSSIVGLCFDDNYVYPFFVLAFSLKKNATKDFRIYVANLNKGISHQNITMILEFSQCFDIDIEFLDFKFDLPVQTDEKISIASFGRFFLMETIDFDFIYLDVDTLANYGWDLFLERSIRSRDDSLAVQATTEPRSLYFRSQPRYLENQARQLAGDCYLFAMLLIVNVKKLRTLDFSRAWREAAQNHLELGFMQHDQDVLNYVLSGLVEPLQTNVNHLHGTETSYPSFFSSCIGHPKPWTISTEEQIEITGLWSLGFKDIGKSFWVRDFYEYWSYEHALHTECMNLNKDCQLSGKLSSLRETVEKPFLNNRARLKWKVLAGMYRILNKTSIKR